MEHEATIRPFDESDWPQVWSILEPIFRDGSTYAVATSITQDEARELWVDRPLRTYVTVRDSTVTGTYYLKPNQAGNGSHVCNCGYAVAHHARGQGLATRMCEHSQLVARELQFYAMQFNLVVASNRVAVDLWKRLGFSIVGTLPDGFDHPELGLVDAHVMFKKLV